jgi:hypothetical protein
MTEKPDFENFDSILENFDKFCDEFETRATEAFMRGDQDNGKVVRAATEKLGGETPSAVTEIGESGAEGIEFRETDDCV